MSEVKVGVSAFPFGGDEFEAVDVVGVLEEGMAGHDDPFILESGSPSMKIVVSAFYLHK